MLKLPRLVRLLTQNCDGWLVGSAAHPQVIDPRDFDVLIPPPSWHLAAMLIPQDAKPNRFGGWKCISENAEVDVWPEELSAFLIRKPADTSGYLRHIRTGILLKECD